MSTEAKELVFDQEARAYLKEGIDTLGKIAKITLGPKGRNVGIEKGWGSPTVTNDGDSIVQEVENKEQFSNMGIGLGKEVASQMKAICGDGTTTSIVLLAAIVEGGIKHVTAGASPILLKRGIDKAVEAVITQIESISHDVHTAEQIKNIATASASGNSEIGSLIASAFEKVGRSGVITIEEGKKRETDIEVVQGMQFDRGYTSPYFCTNAEKMVVEMEDVRILVTDKKISSVGEMLPLLQAVAASGDGLIIIADDIEGEALSTLVINRLRGTLKVCAIKAPAFGERRKAILEDLALLTGSTFICEAAGRYLKDATPDVLGTAGKVIITKDKTTIIDGGGDAEIIASRIKQIEAEEKNPSTEKYEREKLAERRAKLAGGVAVIKVGAPSESEAAALKQQFADSLNSTKSALEEGYVAGGGLALLRSSEVIHSLELEGDEKFGADIIYKACQAPSRQIAENAGEDGSLIIKEVLKASGNHGYDAMSGTIIDLVKAGVIDPSKVVKNGLKFAASTAGIIILSEVLIGDAPQD